MHRQATEQVKVSSDRCSSSRARRRDHITSVLHELHWLPFRQRIKFKVTCLAFQSLSGQAPEYLVHECSLVTRSLRSADIRTCTVPWTHNRYGDRSSCFRSIEHSTKWLTTIWNKLRTLSMTTENRLFSRCIVTCWYMRFWIAYFYLLLTYLMTYLSKSTIQWGMLRLARLGRIACGRLR
jgi:hypothetical protein